MSEKITKRQAEKSRQAIMTTQILNRLQAHGDGEVELTSSQIKSYEILLKHSLPALTATEITEIKEEINPENLEQRLMDIFRNNPDIARKFAALANKKPELKVVNDVQET